MRVRHMENNGVNMEKQHCHYYLNLDNPMQQYAWYRQKVNDSYVMKWLLAARRSPTLVKGNTCIFKAVYQSNEEKRSNTFL